MFFHTYSSSRIIPQHVRTHTAFTQSPNDKTMLVNRNKKHHPQKYKHFLAWCCLQKWWTSPPIHPSIHLPEILEIFRSQSPAFAAALPKLDAKHERDNFIYLSFRSKLQSIVTVAGIFHPSKIVDAEGAEGGSAEGKTWSLYSSGMSLASSSFATTPCRAVCLWPVHQKFAPPPPIRGAQQSNSIISFMLPPSRKHMHTYKNTQVSIRVFFFKTSFLANKTQIIFWTNNFKIKNQSILYWVTLTKTLAPKAYKCSAKRAHIWVCCCCWSERGKSYRKPPPP